ncbi:MAG: hypothetical protein KDC88_06770 [Ignavibacteriae bacterium]|nr:hypothetical protein [Ignavibacteriota bacterium]
MQHYQTLLALHIVFAGIWVIFFVVDLIFKSSISKNSDETKNEVISLYLNFTNLFGIIGSIGIALTGIILVSQNPGYGFFDMSHAHWLATKQILFVAILAFTFLKVIPTAKKLRSAIANSNSDEIKTNLEVIIKANKFINILVILNFIFAITHRFYS